MPRKRPRKKARRRKKISREVETSLLTKCKRRCALCFHFRYDYAEKIRGQIAHIDRDSSNAEESNLAWLCKDCHDDYDIKSLQSKRISEGELLYGKAELEKFMSLQGKMHWVRGCLRVDTTREDYEKVLAEILDRLKPQLPVRTKEVRQGSVIFDLELAADDLARLMQAHREGKLKDLGVEAVEFLGAVPPRRYTLAASKHWFPGELEMAIRWFENPDVAQSLSLGETKAEVRVSVWHNRIDSGMAGIVVAIVENDTVALLPTIFVSNKTLYSWPIDNPVELLLEHLKLFGIPMQPLGGEILVIDRPVSLDEVDRLDDWLGEQLASSGVKFANFLSSRGGQTYVDLAFCEGNAALKERLRLAHLPGW